MKILPAARPPDSFTRRQCAKAVQRVGSPANVAAQNDLNMWTRRLVDAAGLDKWLVEWPSGYSQDLLGIRARVIVESMMRGGVLSACGAARPSPLPLESVDNWYREQIRRGWR